MSDSVCKDLYSTQRTYHITIIIYLTQLNAGPEFRFGNFSLSQVFTLRKNYNAYKDTRQQCSNYTVDFGEPISFFFFITGWGGGGWILCACDGLTKIHKSYGGGGGGGANIYIYVGPYEIHLNFSQNLFYFFLNTFFSISIFLDSVFSIFILWTPF